MKKLLGILGLAFIGLGEMFGQGCSVSLGNDTSFCAGGQVSLDIAAQFDFFEDSLRIRYDASQGQTGLVGSPKVYMHSGAELVPFGGWQYVVGNWGQDDGIGQMKNIGGNMWEITIHPESYYGLPAGSNLNGIFMVFRNAPGSQTGKDAGGNDIFLDLSGSAPTSAFTGVTGWWKTDAVTGILWSDGSTGTSIQANSAGSYWVQVTDTAGCIAADTMTVTISSGAVVDLGPNQIICPGQTATLDAGAGFTTYLWNTGATTQSISVATTGNYYVTVTDAGGCEGLDLVYVEAKTLPVAGFTYTGVGQNYAFTNTAQGAVSYAWDFDNNGSTDATTDNPSHTFPATGSFTVVLIVTNECGSDTISQVIQVGLVSVAEEIQATIQVSPNPFSNQIRIAASETNSGFTVALFDLSGRQVLEQQGESGQEVVLETVGLPAGTYLMYVKTNKSGESVYHRLLIKE